MLKCDVLVIGLGHAGMAAAVAAAEGGASVIAIDDNPMPGGQISRAKLGKVTEDFARGMKTLAAHRATLLRSTSLVDLPSDTKARCIGPDGSTAIRFASLILATGSRELFLPFPGWTLPGVMGAGGLQALAKGGLSVEGKRIVVAGSGPLLLPVAQYLRRSGARVFGPFEQASAPALLRFAAQTVGSKAAEMVKFAGVLPGYRPGTWITRATGSGRVESVEVNTGRRYPCDYVACSFGLVPNTEAARLAGCIFEGEFVRVDGEQRTSVPNIFAAGEITGIGGHDKASVEGSIAGKVAAGLRPFEHELRDARRLHAFASLLAKSFGPRRELRALAQEDTVVCRCEDVPLSALRPHGTWRDAKLQTRCGMGPCQGRICGPAIRALFGWDHDTIRAPLTPVPLEALASGDE
jgi:NADPH-dependent 2,4-dienoyl-CoA reductase/sulfur reductase-like enzyme